MPLDPTFAKVVAIVVVGGVAKTLLDDRPAPIHNHYAAPEPKQD